MADTGPGWTVEPLDPVWAELVEQADQVGTFAAALIVLCQRLGHRDIAEAMEAAQSTALEHDYSVMPTSPALDTLCIRLGITPDWFTPPPTT